MTLKKVLKYSLIITLCWGIASCKKKPEVPLGADVQDGSDALFSLVSDTATIEMHTVKYDSLRTYRDQFKYLGSNQDPVFGRTNASIFTNFSLPTNVSNVNFGDYAVLDSSELILTFTQSFVGDTTIPLHYQVHQLTQLMDYSKYYYTHHNIPYSSSTITDAFRRITKTGGFYTIRLPLDKNYAAAILNNPQYLVSNTVFQNTYKGFFITTKNTNLSPAAHGSLMKIDLDNPTSGVYLYYHDGSPSSSKSPEVYRLPFSADNSARFNHVDYDYHSGGNSLLVDQLDKIDTAKGKQNLFLKGIGGAKSVIRLPYLKNYSDSCPIAVNRAELIFKVDQSFLSSIGNYEPPNMISLVACDPNGTEIYVKDQFYTADILRFGGSYDPVNKQYVFNFARHIQDIMSGKLNNYGFYLVLANTDRFSVVRRDDKAERLILGGLSNALYRPTFKLTYIRLPYDK